MTNTTRSTATLFTPAQFGSIEIKNRLVMAPMTRSQSPGHVPNDRNVEYYRRRAAGGVGLIISEGTTIGHPAADGYPDVPRFAGDEALAGWKRVVEAVHAEGAKMIPQLWHVGSVRKAAEQENPDVPGVGPSAIVHPANADAGGPMPVAMSESDIAEVIGLFAESARAAEAAGFDGVELHGAHAYLIDQFFWEATNQRTDRYGGDLVQRTTFACELIRAVRAAVKPDFPVCLRYSQWKQGDYRHKMAKTPDELGAFLAPLVEAGVDVFHCSTRRFNDPEFEGSNLNLAGWTKKLTGKPTITVGSIGLDSDFLRTFAGKPANAVGIDQLIERMDNGEFEFAAIGRALLADAEWPSKLKRGAESEAVAFEPKHIGAYP